jgi:mannose-6-phosphate isomerase-like protein (cupin superfamily)
VQFRLQCCGRIVNRKTCSEEPCAICGKENPICAEVDKEDMVFMAAPVGFSGDDKYEEREWGSFQILLDEPKVKVKKITVKPDQRLSLQLHRKREELWYVISGFGEMQVGSKVFDIESGRVIKINKYEVHRVKCAGLNDLVLVEIQTGICQEDDIVRIEDDYGRE